MAEAFAKDLRRSIFHSIGRFIAIAIITGLGTGFFSGLMMTGPDMRLASDTYFDAAHFSDLRVAGTLGLDDESIRALEKIEGVETVDPEYEVDTLCFIDGVQYAVRVHSLDIDAAQASKSPDGIEVISDDPAYLNRPVLVSGTWPSSTSECLLCADAVLDNPVNIGDRVAITLVAEQDDPSTVLNQLEFTVSGFVRTPYYTSSASMGSTSLANGKIEDYMMIPEGAFASDFPYTGAFIQVAGAREKFYTSAAYDELVDSVASRVEAAGPSISGKRYDAVVGDANSELNDAWSEYRSARTDTMNQLSDARRQLNNARRELDSAETELPSSKAQLDDAKRQIDASQIQLEQAAQDIAKSEEQLAELEGMIAQLEDQRAQVMDGIDALVEAEDELNTLIAIYRELAPTDPEAAQKLAELEARIAQVDAQLQEAQAQLDTLDAGIAEASAQLSSGRAQVEAGKAQYESGVAQLNAAREQYESGMAQYEQGVRQYESGMGQYESGLSEYESGFREAQDKFAEAEDELAKAQADIDEIRNPDWYVLDRHKNFGAESYISDAERIDNIARVFPLIFFLVAALVALTTMTRMVDEERIIIGTYKALGYSNAKIISKYLIYAAISSAVGSIIGIIALAQFLPYFIMHAYAIMYQVPLSPTPIDPIIALSSAALGMGITLGATWWAARASLREKPAQLMLPRVPKAGKRILLERVKPLWSHMSFSWKVTARNIFRYKRRFFMAIIGIAGCTALLLTGFGLSNSINDIIDKQYGDDAVFVYNLTVTLDDDVTEAQREHIEQTLANDTGVKAYTPLFTKNMIAVGAAGDEHRLEVMATENPDDFNGFVTFRERISHKPLSINENEALITEKLAKQLGIGVGDEMVICEQDTVGNAIGEGYHFKICGVTENYVNSFLYTTKQGFTSVTGFATPDTTCLAKTSPDDAQRQAVLEHMHDCEGVSTVAFVDDAITYYRKALKAVDSVVIILIIAAAALAFVVVYNLTNINIAERQREIATLKVLGFTSGENVAYIFRETILLSVLGGIFGLVLGIFLEGFVITTAEVDLVMFGREIHAWSFVLAFALTMVFTAVVMLFMKRKLDHISMVESLKSIE